MLQAATQSLRTCSKCASTKPLTSEHFQRDSQKSSGFRPDCKTCRLDAYARKHPDGEQVSKRALAADGLKRCIHCLVAKPLSEFNAHRRARDGLRSNCKGCQAAETKARRDSDPNSFDANSKAYRKRHPELVRQRAREYQQRRRATDPAYRLRGSASRLAGCALQRRGSSKAGAAFFAAVGYSPQELIAHLERQFTKGMSLENYGEWQIDHITPVSSFNFTSMTDPGFLACWCLSNLRPLWKDENRRKGKQRTHLL